MRGGGFFSNVLVSVDDATHAVRRILKRPGAAVPFLKALMENYVTGPSSIVQLIRNSTLFTEWLMHNIGNLENHPANGRRINSLRAALHRFESWTAPLARLVLYWQAFVMTAQKIIRERQASKDKAYLVSQLFIARLSELDLIGLAALTEATQEAMGLLRKRGC